MRVAVGLALGLALSTLCACDRRPEAGGAPAGSASGVPASGSGAPATSASADLPAAPAKPWFEGSWSGTFEARQYTIEMESKIGGVREWRDDDGKAATGDGTLALEVDASGVSTGNGKGPLGELTASGVIEDDTLRLELRTAGPADPASAFHGFVVAERTKGAEELRGLLQASSGDSYVVRDAPVVLTKGPPKASP